MFIVCIINCRTTEKTVHLFITFICVLLKPSSTSHCPSPSSPLCFFCTFPINHCCYPHLLLYTPPPPPALFPTLSFFPVGYELLYQPEVVRIYTSLLKESKNPTVLEASAGAVQNLCAGRWTVRTAIHYYPIPFHSPNTPCAE